MREQEETRMRQEQAQRHLIEMQALDDAHRSELDEFHHKWDRVMIVNFQNECDLLDLELKKRHHHELEQAHEKADEGFSAKFKPSSEVLELRQKVARLAVISQFKEAQKL